MNTGASQVFIEGVPRRVFGYFLRVQKVTYVPHKKLIHILSEKCGQKIRDSVKTESRMCLWMVFTGRWGRKPPQYGGWAPHQWSKL